MLDCCYFCNEEKCQVVTVTRNVVVTFCGISRENANGYLTFADKLTGKTSQISSIRFFRVERRIILGEDVNCSVEALCTPQACPVCVKYEEAYSDELDPTRYTLIEPAKCEQLEVRRLKAEIARRYQEAKTALLARARSTYEDVCLDIATFTDKTKINYNESFYHYTLAYYDRAGRLSKTVPPRGVDFNPTRTRLSATVPHSMATTFAYNSLGQIMTKEGPDEGKTTYRYDAKGRLRFTIDAVQRSATPARASYIRYDKLSRVVETGEITGTGDIYALIGDIFLNIDDQGFPGPPFAKKDVKRFYYTAPAPAGPNDPWTAIAAVYSPAPVQKHLRGRLSWAESIPDATGTNATKDVVRTFYSYDEHGNLSWSIHDIPYDNTTTSARLIKRTEYEYDHTLGVVKRVDYQKGESDRFIHEYTYDDDGSLKEVATSHDDVIWERDARYTYFEHGPLRRVVLGEDRVQGIDFTYTITGQLKAINTPNRDVATDPGNDGLLNESDVRDAFGMSLSYYSGDFARTSASGSSPFNSGSASLLAPTVNLYSGLIGTTTWSTQDHSNTAADIVREGQTIGEAYRYDVLGRLRSVTTHKKETNGWTAEPTGGWSSSYKYDPHGNFLRLKRQALDAAGSSVTVDDATFYLKSGRNTLDLVSDAYTLSTGSGQEVEGIDATSLHHDAEGKIQDASVTNMPAVTGYNSDDLMKTAERGNETSALVYDIAGNVVRQDVVADNVTTRFYTIPATPTSDRAVYQSTANGPSIQEWAILGLGRIGVDRTTQSLLIDGNNIRPVGSTLYELNDNVGSVRAIVSDVVDPDPNNQGFYLSSVESASDYEAYGSRRNQRYVDLSEPYRYGWQGMKLLDGIERRTDYITLNRLYDVRLGRWNRPDPIFDPSMSPYQSMGLNPLSYIDPLGLEIITPGGAGDVDGGLLTIKGAGRIISDIGSAIGDFIDGVVDLFDGIQWGRSVQVAEPRSQFLGSDFVWRLNDLVTTPSNIAGAVDIFGNGEITTTRMYDDGLFRGPIHDNGRLYFEELEYYGPENPVGTKPTLAGGGKSPFLKGLRTLSRTKGWLDDFEGGPYKGHTKAWHVGMTIRDLQDRGKQIASSFIDQAAAEFGIIHTLRNERKNVENWLNTAKEGDFMEFTSTVPIEVGYYVERGTAGANFSNRVVVRLVKSSNSRYGFEINSAFVDK